MMIDPKFTKGPPAPENHFNMPKCEANNLKFSVKIKDLDFELGIFGHIEL